MDALPSVLARLFLESMILGGAIDLFAVLVQIFNLLIFIIFVISNPIHFNNTNNIMASKFKK